MIFCTLWCDFSFFLIQMSIFYWFMLFFFIRRVNLIKDFQKLNSPNGLFLYQKVLVINKTPETPLSQSKKLGLAHHLRWMYIISWIRSSRWLRRRHPRAGSSTLAVAGPVWRKRWLDHPCLGIPMRNAMRYISRLRQRAALNKSPEFKPSHGGVDAFGFERLRRVPACSKRAA